VTTDARRFAPLLERASRELDLPQPAKSLVLEEIAADATGLYARLRARGVSEAAAELQVEAWLAAAPSALRELEQIHRPIYLRWAARLSEPGRHRLERTAFACVVLLQIAGALPLIGGAAFTASPAGTGWLVLLLGVFAVSIAVERVFSLWILKSHGATVRRRYQIALLSIALAAPAVAFVGAAFALMTVATQGGTATAAWRAVQVASSLLATGLMIGLFAITVLFVVETRVRWIERLDLSWQRSRER
jgi:hypothetical protein